MYAARLFGIHPFCCCWFFARILSLSKEIVLFKAEACRAKRALAKAQLSSPSSATIQAKLGHVSWSGWSWSKFGWFSLKLEIDGDCGRSYQHVILCSLKRVISSFRQCSCDAWNIYSTFACWTETRGTDTCERLLSSMTLRKTRNGSEHAMLELFSLTIVIHHQLLSIFVNRKYMSSISDWIWKSIPWSHHIHPFLEDVRLTFRGPEIGLDVTRMECWSQVDQAAFF